VPHALALWGCPSTGGQLTGQRRPSATRPRLAGRPSFGGQRQVLCRGKPQHRQPTVAASPPPLGGSGGLRYSCRNVFLASNKKSGRQHGEYLALFPAWLLGLFWRSKPPLPNRSFKGTPTALASLRKCQARRPLTFALAFFIFVLHRAPARLYSLSLNRFLERRHRSRGSRFSKQGSSPWS